MATKRLMLGLVCALLTMVWAAGSQAQTTYSLTGNLRGQIGDGLPVPITFQAIPNGPIKQVQGATIMETVGGALVIPPGQFARPIASRTIPVFAANSAVFQVRTNLGITFPRQSAVFAAGGRSGPATASWCPGQLTAMTPSAAPVNVPNGAYNPGCVQPSDWATSGRLKYKATGAQFGGKAISTVTGTADVALNAAQLTSLPCDFMTGTCQIAFATANPNSNPNGNGTWGAKNSTPGFAPNPGLYNGKVNAAGAVLSVTATGLGAGNANASTNWVAPWTTGVVYVTATGTAEGYSEMFTLSGSDNRVNGIGSISLVSGNVSERVVTGPNANRGWLNITISQQVPGIPGANWAIFALVMVMGGTAFWMIRRAVATEA